jgi:multidrug efflux pump subunit AcrA (membrane-fusion protein)
MSSKKKHANKAIIFVVIAVVVALIALVLLLRPRRSGYSEVTAKTGNITTYYSFSGTIEAINSQTVYADSMAQIDEVDVKEGQAVKKDDVLMKTKAGDSIKSPIDGTVESINAEEGEQEMSGAALCKIVDYNDLDLNVQVDEYDLPAITVGKKATVTINALSKDLSCKITEISQEGTNQNGVTYFNAKVSLPAESDLRVGMTAEAKVLNKKATSVTLLPESAVQFDSSNNPYVYVSGEKNTVREVALKVGINDGTNVEVKSGVDAGDKILVPDSTSSASTGFGMGNRTSVNNQSSSASSASRQS